MLLLPKKQLLLATTQGHSPTAAGGSLMSGLWQGLGDLRLPRFLERNLGCWAVVLVSLSTVSGVLNLINGSDCRPALDAYPAS